MITQQPTAATNACAGCRHAGEHRTHTRPGPCSPGCLQGPRRNPRSSGAPVIAGSCGSWEAGSAGCITPWLGALPHHRGPFAGSVPTLVCLPCARVDGHGCSDPCHHEPANRRLKYTVGASLALSPKCAPLGSCREQYLFACQRVISSSKLCHLASARQGASRSALLWGGLE